MEDGTAVYYVLEKPSLTKSNQSNNLNQYQNPKPAISHHFPTSRNVFSNKMASKDQRPNVERRPGIDNLPSGPMYDYTRNQNQAREVSQRNISQSEVILQSISDTSPVTQL